jgi:homocitrate synthase NifV
MLENLGASPLGRLVKLVDTTLRDGHQAPGLALSPATRIRLGEALDRAGVDRIEAGSPAMGATEIETVRRLKGAVRHAEISVWSRLNLDDVSASLAAGPDIVHICFPISERQTRTKLRLGWRKTAELLERAVNLCARKGYPVSVGLEDFSRASSERLEKAIALLLKLNLQDVRLPDTVGILTPLRTRELVLLFKGRGFNVEFHAHNDLGIADANSLVAALAGAAMVDTTLGGIGERAGNSSLSGFVELATHARGLRFKVDLDCAIRLEDDFLPFLRREGYLSALKSSRSADITDFGAACRKML